MTCPPHLSMVLRSFYSEHTCRTRLALKMLRYLWLVVAIAQRPLMVSIVALTDSGPNTPPRDLKSKRWTQKGPYSNQMTEL
jgi:hypothetical protein